MAVFAQKRRRKKQRSNRLRVFVLLFVLALICGAIGAGVWYGTRLAYLTIQEVMVSGGETVSHDDLRRLVEEELSGTYLYLIPKRFTYFYPQEAIRTRIADMSRVRDVRVARTDTRTLTISFNEYVPQGLWCASGNEQSACFFISNAGYAFAEAPTLRGGVFARHVSEVREPALGEHLIDEGVLREINTFIDALQKQLNFRIGHVTHTQEGDIIYHVNGAGQLLVATDMTAQQSFDNLRSIIESPEYAHLSFGNFQYIDLRFGDRVFVNEEEPIVPETATSTATTTTSSE